MEKIFSIKWLSLMLVVFFFFPGKPAVAKCRDEAVYVCTEWYPSGDCKKTIKGTHRVCDSESNDKCYKILDCVEFDDKGKCIKQEYRDHCPTGNTGNPPPC